MRILYWIISIPIAVLIAVFAVSNRASVSISLWPLPYEIDMPLFMPIMAALLIGLGIGFSWEWLLQGKHRRAARQMDHELKRIKTAEDTAKPNHKALGHG